jgi:hypothetical protein
MLFWHLNPAAVRIQKLASDVTLILPKIVKIGKTS